MATDSLALAAIADEEKIDMVVVGKDVGGGVDEKIVALYGTQVGNGGN